MTSSIQSDRAAAMPPGFGTGTVADVMRPVGVISTLDLAGVPARGHS